MFSELVWGCCICCLLFGCVGFGWFVMIWLVVGVYFVVVALVGIVFGLVWFCLLVCDAEWRWVVVDFVGGFEIVIGGGW